MFDYKKISLRVSLLVIFLLVGIIGRSILLGGASVETLGPAPGISGEISQSLVSSSQNGLPMAGKDFVIKSTTYFDTNTWVVVIVGTVADPTNESTIVMQKVSGVYQIVIGPGTAFTTQQVANFPADVISFISSHGTLIYNQT
jgi:hypothetical protein